MKITFRKIGVYGKLAAMLLLLFVVFVFMFSNRDLVELKFFKWTVWQAPAFALILASISFGVTVFWLSRKIRGVLRDMRELRREEKARLKLINEIKVNQSKQDVQQ